MVFSCKLPQKRRKLKCKTFSYIVALLLNKFPLLSTYVNSVTTERPTHFADRVRVKVG